LDSFVDGRVLFILRILDLLLQFVQLGFLNISIHLNYKNINKMYESLHVSTKHKSIFESPNKKYKL
jgi:hypothetical protein